MASPSLSSQLLQILCSAGGCLEQGELSRRCRALSGREFPVLVLQDPDKFTVVTRTDPSAAEGGPPGREQRVVVATSAARLCRDHGGQGAGCGGQCGQFHLCRYFLKQCKFIHNFWSEHNLCIVKRHGLENLNNDELRQLLLQNDSSLLPEICMHYNKGDGPYGSCTFKKICVKLHICQYYLQGECKYGSSCRRSHDINRECYEKLEKWGMSQTLISKLPSIYRNMYDIKNGAVSPCKVPKATNPRHCSQSKIHANTNEESEQICLYHIRKSCTFQAKCIRVHFDLPYRWQIADGTAWKDLKDMEKIEKAYCDPNIRHTCINAGDSLELQRISFRTMTCDLARVRRLSTASSVTKPPHFILTTVWLWYWKDEYGVWNEYGKQVGGHANATVCSDDLEKAFLSDGSSTLQFKAGKHEYELDFKAMKQKNLRYQTERKVCRRPKFVSSDDVKKRRIRSSPDLLLYLLEQMIKLLCSSDEYTKVQTDFQRTMPKTVIVKIERIQNLALWEVYQWQKEQMQKANKGEDVDERHLYHGTNKEHIDAICEQNFDWRICGLHGTAYGKGSYFARDASYSDNYSKSNSSIKTMFLARVLVGEFTTGSSSYLRPPAKDDKKGFYDSCVNSVSHPSIFVIFEKHQIYPEYLIEYGNQTTAAPALSTAATIASSSAIRRYFQKN
uniref:Poly(ADP-ribose) polymerase family member 12 n=1 Tax=Sphenodon punctatus TaxID=8508 RepID=A0A8D0GSZ7_SPHPU